MAWESLGKSLTQHPRVLAGPVLRKVTPTSVTVWLATRVGGKVTLTVQDDKDNKMLQGERHSVAAGKNLHIVAVTANMLPPWANMVEGTVYRYDLTFAFDDNLSTNLATATGNANLAYPPLTLPSFALPPKDLSLLRLIQGSCRKPNGDGRDMLPFLSQLIEQTASNAFARPHQLLLTGDQIYADDVAASMLVMLTDAASVLLGWDEILPVPASHGGPMPATSLSPFLRDKTLEDAGFTSEDLICHLMSLGEYLCMYLFTWSDAAWPLSGLPAFDDVVANVKKNVDPHVVPLWERFLDAKKEDIERDIASLTEFRRTLPDVRRALANIPSYMIFDDHEVTDDWNMTRDFCDDVYGNDLGLRMIQNGLVAYALCQHWGSVPEQFEDTGQSPVPPGLTLLRLLEGGSAATYASNSPSLRSRVGVHDAATLKARPEYGVFHDPGGLTYNYTVEGPSHQVIVTDTRSWRSFPKAAGTHLLPKNQQTDQFKAQILDAPDTLDRLLFVIITTNAPPAQPIRSATRHDTLSNHLKHYPDVYEAWDLPSESFDRLLVAVTSKLPLDASNQHTGAVVMLSGDVHFSFATRILYRATQRFEDEVQPRGAAAVIAQLIASALKKQTDDTVAFQIEGYYASPKPIITQPMIRHTLTEAYVGWNFSTSARQRVGTGNVGKTGVPIFVETRGTVDVTPAEPIKGEPDSRFVRLSVAPHYRYRFDYLLPTGQEVQIQPPTIPPLPGGSSLEQRKDAARAYDAANRSYRFYNGLNPPRLVGVNNFCEIRLDWTDPAKRKVNHIVRWWDAGSSTLKITTYAVRLDVNGPADPEFPDIKARSEP